MQIPTVATNAPCMIVLMPFALMLVAWYAGLERHFACASLREETRHMLYLAFVVRNCESWNLWEP